MKWKAQMPVRPSGGPIVIGTSSSWRPCRKRCTAIGCNRRAARQGVVSADLAAPPQVLAGPSPVLSASR